MGHNHVEQPWPLFVSGCPAKTSNIITSRLKKLDATSAHLTAKSKEQNKIIKISN